MLRVTIELLPFGREDQKRHLGTIEIANDGTSTSRTRGNYKVRLAGAGKPHSTWVQGAVRDFPRLSLGVYDLLLRALIGTVGQARNKRFVELAKEEFGPMPGI